MGPGRCHDHAAGICRRSVSRPQLEHGIQASREQAFAIGEVVLLASRRATRSSFEAGENIGGPGAGI